MSVAASPVLCRRPAMNTWFEIVLLGDDPENLSAAGEAALDEIERVEKLLSRFDPASEVSRINRDAPNSPVLLDFELADVIETCRKGWMETNGYFDITANRDTNASFEAIDFNPDTRLISFAHEKVRFDFGAFGKGYALDCAARLLRAHGVTQALLHGGTSSVLAIGNDLNGKPWCVDLRNPWDESATQFPVQLSDNALSTSSTGEAVSDIVDPHGRRPLQTQAACTVVAQTAAQAEIFSTAFLCMGKDQAMKLMPPDIKVVWTDPSSIPETL